MKINNRRSYWEYLFIPAIIIGQFLIITYLQPRDSGIFSWPRIIFPNAWLLITSLAWWKLRPLEALRLTYYYFPLFIMGVAVILSLNILFQIMFVKITLYEASPVDVFKFAFLSLVVPFSEELFYRGLFFTTLIRDTKNVVVAAFLVTFFFAIFHLPQGVHVFGFMLLFSGALCYLTYLTKGIMCGVVVHICWNVLYYNKLLHSDVERWLLSIFAILIIGLIVGKASRISRNYRASP